MHQAFIPDMTALSGAALRLHLLELFLSNTDMPDQALPLAQMAEAWISGEAPINVETIAPRAARDVEVGKPWVFDHRTQAEIMAAEAPASVESSDGETTSPATASSPALSTKHDQVLAALRAMLAEGQTVTGSSLGRHMGRSQATASRLLRDLVAAGTVVNRGSTTVPSFVLVDATTDGEIPDQAVPMLKRTRDYAVVTWTEDRKLSLDTMVRQGAEIGEIAQAVGLEEYQVKAQIARQCLTSVWVAANAAKAAPAAVAEPKLAPARPVLPEDRLRAVVDPNGVPADLETVEAWLKANGCKLVVEAPGLYFCDGAMLTSVELVKRANKARKGLKLPPFTVRRL